MVTQDPNNISREKFASYFNNKDMSDVVLNIRVSHTEEEEFEHRAKRQKTNGESTLYASKLFLCSQSSFFRSMFESGFKEKSQTEVECSFIKSPHQISLEVETEEQADALRDVIHYLYNGSLAYTSPDRLLTILKLSGQVTFLLTT